MTKYIFLQDYSLEISEQYSRLLSQHIENLPYTLSFPIYQATQKIKTEQYGAAMNHVLDFFEISVQYASILLFFILKQKTTNNTTHKVLCSVVNKIDNKRPLSFGDWVNDLFIPLLTTASIELPEHSFVKSMRMHVCSKHGNILLGGKKEASIVQIRNEYKGHSTTLSEEIYRGVLYTLEERVMKMLNGLSVLSDYQFYAIDETGTAWNLKSIETKALPSVPQHLHSPSPLHYYVYREGPNDQAEITDLFPLIFLNPQRHVYVFQSLKDENASYISSNENAITYISDALNEEIDTCFQNIIPSFDISKELNWEELKTCMTKESMGFMKRIYKEKKYNQELFVDRERLTSTLYQFWESDKTLFPLLGEAGQGKTSQLCYWTEKLLEQKKAVLIFNGADFSNYTLEQKIKALFGYNYKKPIARLLTSLHEKAEQNKAYVYFFFDAINECLHYYDSDGQEEGPLHLYRSIRQLLVQEKFPRFKVLFTCRFYTWKNLIQRHCTTDAAYIYHAGDEEDLAIRNFTDTEIKQAYHIYQRLYQMTTSYEHIDKKILIRLKDPLILKFASSNYLGKSLSESAIDYTSLSLFNKMLCDIKNSYAGNLQYDIISCIGDYLLNKYMKGFPVSTISTESLKEAYHETDSALYDLSRKIYKKDGISIAYAELLNKAERPILRETERIIDNSPVNEITFVYERFFEFIMARSFIKFQRKKGMEKSKPIPAEAYLEALDQATVNVVFIGTIRNALVIDCLETQNYSTLLELTALHGDNYIVMQLLTEVMNMLIRENYENELFRLIDKMLSEKIANGNELISQLNSINKKIESNQANEEVIANYKLLSQKLAPVIRLRKLASVSTINGILLTDYFNENLYKNDALKFLWRLMLDPIHDVRNDACMYTYYLSNKTHTLDYTPLKRNLCESIILQMFRLVKSRPLLFNMSRKHTRKRSFIFFETATRLGTLLMIDELVKRQKDGVIVKNMLQEIECMARYFTLNFYLLRIFMPVLQILMRKQITFQAVYVNNTIEYQGFWNKPEFLSPCQQGKWTRECIKEAMSFVWHHSKYHECKNSPACLKEEERFKLFYPYILSAYKTGDSFTYFTLERILVIMGVCKWQNIKPCVEKFFTDEYRQSEWFDYSQMSMLYVLFQIALYTKEDLQELTEIYTRESKLWTLRCKGLFKAPNSHKANPNGLYKRNVMTWYCVVYCANGGDGTIHEGDSKCVPMFYELIDIAIREKDKELLIHLIENISELITDFGYIHTAMELLKYILIQYDTPEKVKEIDEKTTQRNGLYQYNLTKVVGNVLSTAKNYYQTETDTFIKKELIGLSFPGIPTYREEILSYNPSGETLSDLFTHKFGKFLTWGLLFEEAIDNFAYEAMCTSINAPNCFSWYDQVVRILLKHLFKLKL